MKTLLIIVPSLRGGGMERIAILLAKYFAESSFRVRILVLKKSESFYNVPSNVEIISPKYSTKKLSNLITLFRTFFKIRRTVKNLNPHAVLSFGETYNSLVVMSLAFINIPIYLANRASPLSSIHGYRGKINPFFYRYAKGVILQTETARNILSNQYSKSNFFVIPNPINLNIRDNWGSRENLILNVGYVGGNKNQEVLIKYFSKLQYWKNWKLCIVGEGPNLESCKQAAIDYGVYENVVFTGAQKEIEKYYEKSKIFAFTSTSEGFPNVLLEAMNFGLACISFNCIAGPSELLIDEENGFLVDEFDETNYIKKLDRLMKNESLCKDFTRKSQLLLQKYDVKNIGKMFMDTMFVEN